MSAAEYKCRGCSYVAKRPLEQCPLCNRWASFDLVARPQTAIGEGNARPKRLGEIDRTRVARVPTGDSEIDRFFGGGVAKGAAILFYATPGFGKSTLGLRLATSYARPLYGVAEESDAQVTERIERLGLYDELEPKLGLWETRSIEALLDGDDDLRIVDSVHAFEMKGAPGAVGSSPHTVELVRTIVQHSKARDVTLLLIAHVNKDGDVSGTAGLEHWVDHTIQGWVDEDGTRRFRTHKNRYGPAPIEMTAKMTDRGLSEFACERREK